MTHVKRPKLPVIKFKKYGSSKTLFLETSFRNGEGSVLLRLEKGPVTQRSKHQYYIEFGYYKSDRLKVVGVDLVDQL